MGTKLSPGAYDCYDKAEPNEPMFILLARDASAPALIEMWADSREKHGEEAGVVAEARECAEAMRAWRDHNRPTGPVIDWQSRARVLAEGLSILLECQPATSDIARGMIPTCLALLDQLGFGDDDFDSQPGDGGLDELEQFERGRYGG